MKRALAFRPWVPTVSPTGEIAEVERRLGSGGVSR